MGAHALSLGERLLKPRRARAFVQQLEDGASTTVYVAAYPRRGTRVRVVALDRPEPLHRWTRANGVPDALSGGFQAGAGTPLGELHAEGQVHMTVPFEEPWDANRSCISIVGDEVTIARRGALPSRARGDLLQAGPLLVVNGQPLAGDRNPQGFGGCAQLQYDITDGRHARAAFGIARDRYLAVVADGRSIRDAGLTLAELACVMAN